MKTTLLFGALLALARVWIGLNVEPESFHWVQAYKDTAHLFMGGLFVAAWRDRQRWQWKLFWGLCAIEVAVAVWSRI
jgi:hypothetical protein